MIPRGSYLPVLLKSGEIRIVPARSMDTQHGHASGPEKHMFDPETLGVNHHDLHHAFQWIKAALAPRLRGAFALLLLAYRSSQD